MESFFPKVSFPGVFVANLRDASRNVADGLKRRHNKKEWAQRICSLVLSFFIAIIPLLVAALKRSAYMSSAGVNLLSTADFFIFSENLFLYFMGGRAVLILLESLFNEFLLSVALLVMFFMVACTLTRVWKKSRGEQQSFEREEDVYFNKKFFIPAGKFFLTYSRFLS